MDETERAEQMLDALDPGTTETDNTEDLRAIAVAAEVVAGDQARLAKAVGRAPIVAAGPASAPPSASLGRQLVSDSPTRLPSDHMGRPRRHITFCFGVSQSHSVLARCRLFSGSDTPYAGSGWLNDSEAVLDTTR